MDDGSKSQGAGIILHTNAFSYVDVNRLSNILQSKFGLKTNLRLIKKNNQ